MLGNSKLGNSKLLQECKTVAKEFGFVITSYYNPYHFVYTIKGRGCKPILEFFHEECFWDYQWQEQEDDKVTIEVVSSVEVPFQKLTLTTDPSYCHVHVNSSTDFLTVLEAVLKVTV